MANETSKKRISYMEFWHFDEDEKKGLIKRLSAELPALRGAVGASQIEVANAVGVSRQTYNSIELQKKNMSWTIYMALILFFDYNPRSHHILRQLDIFPYKLDECWLSGQIQKLEENNEL